LFPLSKLLTSLLYLAEKVSTGCNSPHVQEIMVAAAVAGESAEYGSVRAWRAKQLQALLETT